MGRTAGKEKEEMFWTISMPSSTAFSELSVEVEGFAWYVILPQDLSGSSLGLLDKYVGGGVFLFIMFFIFLQRLLSHNKSNYYILYSSKE